MIKDIRVAVIQTNFPPSKAEGEEQIKRLVKQAVSKPVDLVGLPEDCVASRQDIEDGYDPLSFLSSVSRENGVYLFGATELKEGDGRRFDTGFLFDREGKLVARHNKVVLTPPEVEDGLTQGNSLEVFDTEFGKMAILVCKDSFHRYAAWSFDKLRKAGADVILIPSFSINVTKRSVELWTESLKALAMWFDVYIVASGTIGRNPTDYPSFGHALVVSPSEVVLVEGSADREEILYATLNAKSLEEIRNTAGSKWQPKEIPEVEVVSQE